MKKLFLFAVIALACVSCGNKTDVDLIVHNGVVYTVDSVFTVQQAFAVKNGKIVASGSNEEILAKYTSADTLDVKGKAVFPGFIDAHCHFYNYGLGLNQADLTGTGSFDEVVGRVKAFAEKNPGTGWIIGRGWDQNDWAVKEFPDRKKLDSLFPDRPVFLKRIDGHAALANKAALLAAGITSVTKVAGGQIIFNYVPGGEEVWTDKNSLGEIRHMHYPLWVPTGILVDNAVDLVERMVPPPSPENIRDALKNAERNCVAAGITTVDDAGLMKNVIDYIDLLQHKGELRMRVYAMLSDSAPNYDYYLKHGPYKTGRLNVRSFKFYGDGALGSRGACLKQDYSDKAGWNGFLLNSVAHYEENTEKLAKAGFQVNMHCIGDSAAKIMLAMAPVKGNANAARWRMEHAQVIDGKEIKEFENKDIIPSVQPTHATSDMYWAKDRLGEKRIAYAYAYKTLLKRSGVIALGTDFPVEDISPVKTFYAAVFRKDANGFPEGGFQPEEALTREEAIRGMTIWAAYANFEEKEKGSLENGKFADFVILDTDLMKAEEKNILKTKVIATYINGECVYTVAQN